MAKRIKIVNSSFIVEDTISGYIHIDEPTKDVYFDNEELNNGYIQITQKGNKSVDDTIWNKILLADSVDSNDTIFTSDTFRKFMHDVNSVDVNLQDQHSPIIINNFNKIDNETTITNLRAVGDTSFDVADPTGFATGKYFTIFNTTEGRFMVGYVLSVSTNTINIDTPLDFEYPIGSIATAGITNLNVDGSVTPVIFGVRNTNERLSVSFDITRFIFSGLTATASDLSKFGDLTKLVKGIVIRKVDGTYRNIVNAKSNFDLAKLMYDFNIEAKNNPVQGQDGFIGRLTFAGQDKIGVSIRLEETEDLQVIIQDDLQLLTEFQIMVEGHLVV